MRYFPALAALCLFSASAVAEPVETPKVDGIDPAFDIVRAAVFQSGDTLTFEIDVSGTMGTTTPGATGAMAGSAVHAYVWPISLDSSAVGFGAGEGILALAVTAHPDFDDTPAYDENGDGKPDNDGAEWHSHWVVLTKDEACTAGLKVKDIAAGTDAKLPATAPGVPLLLDSPDARPALAASTLTVSTPIPPGAEGMKFDGVTAGLKVNVAMASPLLCVTDVFKIASGDLSLPGTVDAK